MPSVPDSSSDFSLLDYGKAYIKNTRNKPGNVFLAVIHRIDRPVSGLVCFARTSKAASRLSRQIRMMSVKKHYLACVGDRPRGVSGTVKTFLKKNRKRNVVYVVRSGSPEAREAVTMWRLIGERDGVFLLHLQPITGRAHQLRVHLSRVLCCPIIGDVKYGADQGILGGKGLALHSWRLEIDHPTRGCRMEFSDELPELTPFSLFKEIVSL